MEVAETGVCDDVLTISTLTTCMFSYALSVPVVLKKRLYMTRHAPTVMDMRIVYI